MQLRRWTHSIWIYSYNHWSGTWWYYPPWCLVYGQENWARTCNEQRFTSTLTTKTLWSLHGYDEINVWLVSLTTLSVFLTCVRVTVSTWSSRRWMLLCLFCTSDVLGQDSLSVSMVRSSHVTMIRPRLLVAVPSFNGDSNIINDSNTCVCSNRTLSW